MLVTRLYNTATSTGIESYRVLEWQKVMNYITEDNIRSVDGGIFVFIMDYEVIVWCHSYYIYAKKCVYCNMFIETVTKIYK